MNQRTRIMLVIAAVLTLVAILRYSVFAGGQTTDLVQPAPPPQANVEIRQESGDFLPPFSAFAAITDRPLFRADRRPAPEMVVETPVTQTPVQQPDGAPEFTVIGTVTGPNGGVATIRLNDEAGRYYVGDTVDGWRVEEITTSMVEVSRNGATYRVRIGEDE
jgi:hypothetical protein